MDKKLLLALASLTFMFAFLSIISATNVTLGSPATSGNVVGTYNFNTSFDPSFTNVANCSFYAVSASTANSSLVNVSTGINSTTNQTFVSGSFNSAKLEDANTYTFLAACWNVTATQINSSNSTSVTIDNTVPTVASALSPTNLVTNTSTGTYNFSATLDNPTSTGCTVFISSTNSNVFSPLTTTNSTTLCYATKDFNSSGTNGDYFYTIQSTDGTNYTNATNTLYVRIAGSNGGVADTQQAQQVQNQNTLALALAGGSPSTPSNSDNTWVWWVVGIIVIITILYFLFKKK